MRTRYLLAVALLVLAAGGCSDVIDDTVVFEISTLVPSLVDSDLAGQAVQADVPQSGGTIQNVWFKAITELTLTFDDVEYDLLFDESGCQFFDVWNDSRLALGKCAGGVVLDGDKEPHTMSLHVVMQVQVQRVPPLPLPPQGDYDVDGVLNADDNCVLVDNPDQTDTGGRGFGDACSTVDFFTGVRLLDSDADSVGDVIDNCPYTPNPGQEDSGIDLDGVTVPDGIGDACMTETAYVNGMDVDVDLMRGPITATTPLRQVGWLALDLNDSASLTGCWDVMNNNTCSFSEGASMAIQLCYDQNGGLGCN
jgi:hypothetical protein